MFPYDTVLEEEESDAKHGTTLSISSKSYLQIQNFKKWNKIYLLYLREHRQRTRGPIKETIKVGEIVQIHNENKRSSRQFCSSRKSHQESEHLDGQSKN